MTHSASGAGVRCTSVARWHNIGLVGVIQQEQLQQCPIMSLHPTRLRQSDVPAAQLARRFLVVQNGPSTPSKLTGSGDLSIEATMLAGWSR